MDADPRTDPYVARPPRRDRAPHHAWVLANATVDAPPDGDKLLNLDVMFDPTATVVGTYAKRHLVPFGEYVPFRGVAAARSIGARSSRCRATSSPGTAPGLFDGRRHPRSAR